MYSSARHAHRCRACRHFGGERRLIAAALRIIHRGRGAEKMPSADSPLGQRSMEIQGSRTVPSLFIRPHFPSHVHRIIAVCGKPVLRQQLAASGILLLQLDGPYIHWLRFHLFGRAGWSGQFPVSWRALSSAQVCRSHQPAVTRSLPAAVLQGRKGSVS